MSRRLLMWGLWATTTAVATTVAWAGTAVVTQTVTNDHTPPIAAKAVRAAVSRAGQTEVAAGTLPTTGTGSVTSPVADGSLAPPPGPSFGGAPQSAAAPGPSPTGASTYGGGHVNSEPAPAPPSSGGHAPSPLPPPAPAPPAPAPAPAPSPSSAAPPAPPPAPQGSSQPANVAAPAPAPTQHHDDGGSDDDHSGSSGTGSSGQASPNVAASSQATLSDAGGTVTVTCQGTSIGLATATPFDGYSFNVQSAGPASVVVVFTGHGQTLTIRAHCYNGQAVQGWGGGGGGDD